MPTIGAQFRNGDLRSRWTLDYPPFMRIAELIALKQVGQELKVKEESITRPHLMIREDI